MKITVPYGGKDLTVEVPDANLIDVVEPAEVEGAVGELQPLPFAPELIIVNDGSRPTPTEAILDEVYVQLPADAKYLIATGTHRAPTEEELERIFGKYLDSIRHEIHVHDARDMDNMKLVGVTASGTEVLINKLCMEAEKILVIGSVEPHYFAGYAGGRKAFLPGTAAYSSTEQNHRHALDAGSAPLALKGNPVHEDLMDAMLLMGEKEVYSIQVVLDRHHEIYSVTAGSMAESFNAAVMKADEVFVVDVAEKADIVVAVAGAPLDETLYQAHKAIENTKALMNEGGVMILVAECGEGMGNDAFVKLLGESETLPEVIETVKAGYKLGYHKAAKLAELIMQSEVWVVSDLPEAELSHIFMKSYSSIQSAIDEALAVKGPDSRLLVVQDAACTVPRLIG